MKTIGMIGGMSWESTHFYYKWMNEYVHAKLGGYNSIEAILYSINFALVMEHVERGDWVKVGQMIGNLAAIVEQAGAEVLILTSNAIHLIAAEVEAAIHIPLIHIADPTGGMIRHVGMSKVGLLGTKITMEKPFYQERLKKKFGIDSLVPESAERDEIHKIIFEELVHGTIIQSSKRKLLQVIDGLVRKGAEGIILGCTELNLLIQQKDTQTRLFDTTALHAKAAVDFALNQDNA